MTSRNRYLPWILVVMTALVLAFVLLRLHNRVQWIALYPAETEQISIKGRIGITFNQPMNTASVEDRFSISPKVDGEIIWNGDSFWFIPQDTLDPAHVYQVSIASGAEAENGRVLRKPITWVVTVREPDLIYLVLGETGGDLWRLETKTKQTYPLTDTNANLVDYAPSPTVDRIAYAQNNLVGGTSLWLIDRSGLNPGLLLDCERDRCTQVTWPHDGAWLAYAREFFNPEDGLYKPARIWMVDTNTGETSPLYQQADAFSHSPSFSPDGKRLATYDSQQNAIRILELETSQESAIPTTHPGTGDWSPDGNQLIFIDLVPGILEPNVSILILDFINQDVRDAFGEFIPNMDYDQPRWSPDGEWIAYGARPVGGGISKGIWIRNLVDGETIPLTDDPAATFSAYRWDPWGEQLVFQRFPLSGPIYQSSIWLWERSSGSIRLLVENGARPEWLP